MAILTISREFGSGGKEIGTSVARLLQYEYADKETMLAELRAAGGKWEEWGRGLDEHCPTIWEKYDWSFRGFGALLQHFMLNRALQNNVVIMGRGGNLLLKGIPYALRVRITAPLDSRIARVMARESVDREQARWLIEKTDGERACFVHALYGTQWDDPEEYELAFDSGRGSLEEIITSITASLKEKDRFASEEAKAALRMRALAAKVKAAIATSADFFIPTLEVVPEGDALVLRGVVHKPEEHKRLEEAARKQAGEAPLRCELHYRR